MRIRGLLTDDLENVFENSFQTAKTKASQENESGLIFDDNDSKQVFMKNVIELYLQDSNCRLEQLADSVSKSIV